MNKINENELGELIILPNGNSYKVKRSVTNYDFVIKTNQDKSYKISVKRGKKSNNSDLKFIFNYSQWNSILNNDNDCNILAFVDLKYENDPYIYLINNVNLNDL